MAKKVIAPASDDAPKKCKLNIASDTADEVEKSAPDNGNKSSILPKHRPQKQLPLQIFELQKLITRKLNYLI